MHQQKGRTDDGKPVSGPHDLKLAVWISLCHTSDDTSTVLLPPGFGKPCSRHPAKSSRFANGASETLDTDNPLSISRTFPRLRFYCSSDSPARICRESVISLFTIEPFSRAAPRHHSGNISTWGEPGGERMRGFVRLSVVSKKTETRTVKEGLNPCATRHR